MMTNKLLFWVILCCSAFSLAASLTSSSYCHKNDENCEEEDEELNLGHITELLRHEDVADTPVSVISIAGALKGGKSTFLSLMAMYLEANQAPDWYSDGEKEIVESFPIGHGSPDRMTTGIDMYHKPIFVTDQNERKVALLLLDTQGSFDKDGLAKFSEIFAISSLLSSVQIYNIKGGINENHLNPLQMFVSFSAKFKSKRKGKPFQKLMFFFQNMPAYSDYPYGTIGGQKYCHEKVLRYSENDPDEVQAVRKALKRSFETIECILFPPPGQVVAGYEPLEKGKKLKLAHFSTKFKETITEVFPILLNPIIIKMEMDREQTGGELANLVEEYQKTIRKNKFAPPESYIKANYRGNAINVIQNLETEYLSEIEKISKNVENEDLLVKEHEKLKEKLLKNFTSQLNGTFFESLFDEYKLVLDSKIVKLYDRALAEFKSTLATYRGNAINVIQSLEAEYLAEIVKVTEKMDSEDLFSKEHEKLKEKLLEKYNSLLGETSFKSLFDEHKLALDSKFVKLYERALDDFKSMLKTHDKQMLGEVRRTYNDLMNLMFDGKSFESLNDANLRALEFIHHRKGAPSRLKSEVARVLREEMLMRINILAERMEINKGLFGRIGEYIDSLLSWNKD